MTTQDEIKKVYNGLFIIVAIGVLVMVITSVVRSCGGKDVEGWITYKRGPDNTIRTGIDGYYPSGTVETGLLAQSPGTDKGGLAPPVLNVNPILRPPGVGLEFSVNGTNRLPPSAPAFYLVPEYRLPYDWPRGFQTNYPVPHVEPLVTIN